MNAQPMFDFHFSQIVKRSIPGTHLAEHLGHGAEFPGAEDFAARHVCLPVYPGMTYHAVEYVAEQVCRAWQPL